MCAPAQAMSATWLQMVLTAGTPTWERETLWMSQPQEKLPRQFEINHKTQIFKKPDYVKLGCVRELPSNVFIFPLPRLSLYCFICSASLGNLLRSQTSKRVFPEQGNGCQQMRTSRACKEFFRNPAELRSSRAKRHFCLHCRQAGRRGWGGFQRSSSGVTLLVTSLPPLIVFVSLSLCGWTCRGCLGLALSTSVPSFCVEEICNFPSWHDVM